MKSRKITSTTSQSGQMQTKERFKGKQGQLSPWKKASALNQALRFTNHLLPRTKPFNTIDEEAKMKAKEIYQSMQRVKRKETYLSVSIHRGRDLLIADMDTKSSDPIAFLTVFHSETPIEVPPATNTAH